MEAIICDGSESGLLLLVVDEGGMGGAGGKGKG